MAHPAGVHPGGFAGYVYGRLMRPDSRTAAPAVTHRVGATPFRRIIARAPTRIDFGGGWTDVPPYPERDGGFVCSVAIARHARVTLHLDAATPADGADGLAGAALRRGGIAGSCEIDNAFPFGAGLGGSSAAGVALQVAIARARGEEAEPEALVQRSRAVEVEELGVAGGWQDHYAAAYGGALALEFTGRTSVGRIPLAPATTEALARRCLLVYSGETRISGANITAVLQAYHARDAHVVDALARMATLARDMATALAAGDIDTLGALVHEHWTYQRSLHPAITTDRIEAISARASGAGALGMKALGASGGGCVAIITGDDPAPVRAAVADAGTIMDYTLDFTGAVLEAAE